MKQTFDLVSHFFALLPWVVLFQKREKEIPRILLYFLSVAVLASLAYHSVDAGFWYDVLHPIDRFFSCSLILLTFWLYIDNWRYTSMVVIFLMLVFVCLEAAKVVDDMVVEGVLLVFVLNAIIVYFCERSKGKNLRKNNLKDPFFGSFFITQILAVIFFIVDTAPYYHSLWHLFAFVSLASVLTHSGTTSIDNETDTRLFYLLGSLPSRLFIAWIFIDWESGDGSYVGWVFAFLAVFMFVGLISSLFSQESWTTPRRQMTSALGCVAYFGMAGFLFSGNIYVAGWIFVGSTAASAGLWGWEKRTSLNVCVKKKKYKKVPTLQLNNMVF